MDENVGVGVQELLATAVLVPEGDLVGDMLNVLVDAEAVALAVTE